MCFIFSMFRRNTAVEWTTMLKCRKKLRRNPANCLTKSSILRFSSWKSANFASFVQKLGRNLENRFRIQSLQSSAIIMIWLCNYRWLLRNRIWVTRFDVDIAEKVPAWETDGCFRIPGRRTAVRGVLEHRDRLPPHDLDLLGRVEGQFLLGREELLEVHGEDICFFWLALNVF